MPGPAWGPPPCPGGRPTPRASCNSAQTPGPGMAPEPGPWLHRAEPRVAECGHPRLEAPQLPGPGSAGSELRRSQPHGDGAGRGGPAGSPACPWTSLRADPRLPNPRFGRRPPAPGVGPHIGFRAPQSRPSTPSFKKCHVALALFWWGLKSDSTQQGAGSGSQGTEGKRQAVRFSRTGVHTLCVRSTAAKDGRTDRALHMRSVWKGSSQIKMKSRDIY